MLTLGILGLIICYILQANAVLAIPTVVFGILWGMVGIAVLFWLFCILKAVVTYLRETY